MKEFILKVNVEDVKELAWKSWNSGLTDTGAEDIITLLNENPEIAKVFEQSIINEIEDYVKKNIDIVEE